LAFGRSQAPGALCLSYPFVHQAIHSAASCCMTYVRGPGQLDFFLFSHPRRRDPGVDKLRPSIFWRREAGKRGRPRYSPYDLPSRPRPTAPRGLVRAANQRCGRTWRRSDRAIVSRAGPPSPSFPWSYGRSCAQPRTRVPCILPTLGRDTRKKRKPAEAPMAHLPPLPLPRDPSACGGAPPHHTTKHLTTHLTPELIQIPMSEFPPKYRRIVVIGDVSRALDERLADRAVPKRRPRPLPSRLASQRYRISVCFCSRVAPRDAEGGGSLCVSGSRARASKPRNKQPKTPDHSSVQGRGKSLKKKERPVFRRRRTSVASPPPGRMFPFAAVLCLCTDKKELTCGGGPASPWGRAPELSLVAARPEAPRTQVW